MCGASLSRHHEVYSGVVQRVERPPVKREVAGAEPATRAINSDNERGKK